MNLKLTLKREWFDLIASGEKRFEYREYKDHWISRLINKGACRSFDEVHFTNGYGSHGPFMRCEFKGTSIIQGCHVTPNNSEPIDSEKMYFVIGLGRVLETKNYQQPK
jgi:hypothetical protein